MHWTESEHNSDDAGSGDDPPPVKRDQQVFASNWGPLFFWFWVQSPSYSWERIRGVRPLSHPSAGAFLHSVRSKGRKLMLLNRILTVWNVILYSVPLQPASAVSSACGCLGHLLRNGILRNTTGRLPTKKLRLFWGTLLMKHDRKLIYQAQCECNCLMACKAGK